METFMNVMMSEEQSNFIEGIKKYMLEASNMTESEAYNFAFVVWQHQEWLREFLTFGTSKKNINKVFDF